MRIVCAPDSFKGSLSALEAARAMRRGILRTHPDAEVDLCPVADGGEGTVRALVDATGGELRTNTVRDPLHRMTEAEWGWLGNGRSTAVIEMAAASGLTLLREDERDPTRTSTFGTGELIRTALDAGATRILLGVGGSATHDGGCGAAQALGVRFLGARGSALAGPITGGMLEQVVSVDVAELDPRLREVNLSLCADVDNPLTGPTGAAAVYGPQKGARTDQIQALDHALAHIGLLWRDQLGVDVLTTPGAGAAGGMGGGMMAMLGAEPLRGIDLVLDAVRFGERVQGADLCLTGEGRFDRQSLQGKVCLGVAAIAKSAGVPVLCIAGSRSTDAPTDPELRLFGIRQLVTIASDIPLEEAIHHAAELVEERTAGILETHT